jgi:phosphoinositide-3-kinase regulatory subunit 4
VTEAHCLQLSRNTLTLAKSAAIQNSPTGFWKISPAPPSAKSGLTKLAGSQIPERYVFAAHMLADFSSALREKGFTSSEEKKIIALKDFILKQAHGSRA